MAKKVMWFSPEWMYPVRDALDAEVVEDNPDFILCMSVSQMDKAKEALIKYPKAKLFNYNWDVYEWVWDKPRYPGEDDLYREYGEFLKKGKVWCPSKCTVKRTKQWFGIDSTVIRTFVPLWDHRTTIGSYVLNPVREIPDRYWGRFEQACKELDIPYVSSNHNLSWAGYQSIVTRCKFIVSPLYEMSTGGLTIVEGYYLGKPVLLPDSPWHGGKDYMKERATYFKHDDYEDFKKKLKAMWEKGKPARPNKKALQKEFSAETMAKSICSKLR